MASREHAQFCADGGRKLRISAPFRRGTPTGAGGSVEVSSPQRAIPRAPLLRKRAIKLNAKRQLLVPIDNPSLTELGKPLHGGYVESVVDRCKLYSTSQRRVGK